MAAGKRNITIEKGATFLYDLVWQDSNLVPVDLTGYTARMQVRRTVNSDEALLDFTTENGAITLGGALGTIAIVGAAADTAAIADNIKAGVYDLELISPTGRVKRLVEGDATIKPEVTR